MGWPAQKGYPEVTRFKHGYYYHLQKTGGWEWRLVQFKSTGRKFNPVKGHSEITYHFSMMASDYTCEKEFYLLRSTLETQAISVRQVFVDDLPLYAGAIYIGEAYREAFKTYDNPKELRKQIIKRRYRKGRLRKCVK